MRVGGDDLRHAVYVQAGHIQVSLNGQTIGEPIDTSDISEVRLWGHGGDDSFNASKLKVPVVLDGGEGDDQLSGGQVEDLLLGGLGADRLTEVWYIGCFEAEGPVAIATRREWIRMLPAQATEQPNHGVRPCVSRTQANCCQPSR